MMCPVVLSNSRPVLHNEHSTNSSQRKTSAAPERIPFCCLRLLASGAKACWPHMMPCAQISCAVPLAVCIQYLILFDKPFLGWHALSPQLKQVACTYVFALAEEL
jgi:hypothetical protein